MKFIWTSITIGLHSECMEKKDGLYGSIKEITEKKS